MKKLLIVLLTFLCICNLNAQNENPRSKFPLGINVGVTAFNIMDPEFLLESVLLRGGVDYLFTPHISAETSIGIELDELSWVYSFGGKYWFAGKHRKSGVSPFVGLLVSGIISGVEGGFYYLDIPIGISYIAPSGLQASLQANCMLYYDSYFFVWPTLELRLGWRFKVK